MKRILFALAVLICSNAVFAQNAEKATKYEDVKAEQKQLINAKYQEINNFLAKDDLSSAKQKYAEAEKLMQASLDSDKKFLRQAKTEEEKTSLQRKIDSKTRLFEQSKGFATASQAKDGKRLAVFVMEFAFVTGNY